MSMWPLYGMNVSLLNLVYSGEEIMILVRPVVNIGIIKYVRFVLIVVSRGLEKLISMFLDCMWLNWTSGGFLGVCVLIVIFFFVFVSEVLVVGGWLIVV